MQGESPWTSLGTTCSETPPFATRSATRTFASIAWLVLGSAAYGAAMGGWNSLELAGYTALKLPLLLLATVLVDGLANAAVARASGYRLTLTESLGAGLAAFALAGVVLGSLAPVVGFFDRALPAPWSRAAWRSHDWLGLVHVLAIALAGTAAVRRQRRWLAAYAPPTRRGARPARSAGALAFAWLALDLVVGAQLAWNLRPWFGSPGMPSEFLRDRPFDGTFYESVFRLVVQLFFDGPRQP